MGFLSVHLYACLAGDEKSIFHRIILRAHEQLCNIYSHYECLICGGAEQMIFFTIQNRGDDSCSCITVLV
jgi:hypothetical protein